MVQPHWNENATVTFGISFPKDHFIKTFHRNL